MALSRLVQLLGMEQYARMMASCGGHVLPEFPLLGVLILRDYLTPAPQPSPKPPQHPLHAGNHECRSRHSELAASAHPSWQYMPGQLVDLPSPPALQLPATQEGINWAMVQGMPQTNFAAQQQQQVMVCMGHDAALTAAGCVRPEDAESLLAEMV